MAKKKDGPTRGVHASEEAESSPAPRRRARKSDDPNWQKDHPTSIRWTPATHAKLKEMAAALRPLSERQLIEFAMVRFYSQWKRGELEFLFSQMGLCNREQQSADTLK
jgi:hypothetical protein